MNYLIKEELINAIYTMDGRIDLQQGYCKRAETIIAPILQQHDERLKSALMCNCFTSLKLTETWSEAVRKQMKMEQGQQYVNGYNDAVKEFNKKLEANSEYFKNSINNAFKRY